MFYNLLLSMLVGHIFLGRVKSLLKQVSLHVGLTLYGPLLPEKNLVFHDHELCHDILLIL